MSFRSLMMLEAGLTGRVEWAESRRMNRAMQICSGGGSKRFPMRRHFQNECSSDDVLCFSQASLKKKETRNDRHQAIYLRIRKG
jgi:hypothetical protein